MGCFGKMCSEGWASRLALGLALLIGGQAAGQTYEGELTAVDEQLDTGEYYDLYEIEVAEGQTIAAALTSDDFDCYLAVVSPSREEWQNDDAGDSTNSQLEVRSEEAGTWTVMVTSFGPRETGAYELVVDITDGTSQPDVPDADDTPETPASGGVVLDESSELTTDSPQQLRGQYYEAYTLTVARGQEVDIDMMSSELDCFLIVRTPSGDRFTDDDTGEGTNSQLALTIESDGELTIYATTYGEDQTGAYQLLVSATQPTVAILEEEGSLDKADELDDQGRLVQRFEVEVEAGQFLTVDLTSAEFDTFLIVETPEGERLENDDWDSSLEHSRVTTTAEAGGVYTILVTTFAPREMGDFRVVASVGGGGAGAEEEPESPGNTGGGEGVGEHTGRLAEGDETLETGEFYDLYTFQGQAGQTAVVTLTAEDFDTYLIMTGDGQDWQNDDWEGSLDVSRLEITLPADGQYAVSVTSYAAGETGDYVLNIELDGDAEPTPEPEPNDTESLQTARGELDGDDSQGDTRSYFETHTFEGTAGQQAAVFLTSPDFDTYLKVESPAGELWENDDYEGSLERSRVAFQLPEDGTYTVTVTSFAPQETGEYTLQIQVADNAEELHISQPRIRGVFVGIADYPGEDGDLAHCDEDAWELAEIFEKEYDADPADLVTLTNGQATVMAVEDAIRSQVAQMQPEDLLVIFYTGHGGQRNRISPDVIDLDGTDETLSLVDGAVSDNRLANILDDAPGRVLVVLDSCYAGGFRKDLAGRQGVFGLYACGQDELAYVAEEHQASGYLSMFLIDALTTDRNIADADGNQSLSAGELCEYVRARHYPNGDVPGKRSHSGVADQFLTTAGHHNAGAALLRW